jgi:hypothetical protein
MDVEKLARMANHIAENLQYGTQAEAVATAVDHLLRFWHPTMREQLAQAYERGDVQLSEVAGLAVEAVLTPGIKPRKDEPGGDAG